MREVAMDPAWGAVLRKVHEEHQQFVNPGIRPNVFSWYHARTRMVAALIRQHAPEAVDILDIGCAQGSVSIAMGEMGYRVTGNDIREYYLSYAKLRDDKNVVKFVCANFLDFPAEEKFDAVVFTEVIEHIVDHRVFLRHMFSCMRPRAVAVITTPNHGYFKQPLPSFAELDLREHVDKQFSADGSDHFYLFTKEELINLMKECGFEIVEHRYFLPFLQFGVFRLGSLWKIFPPRLMERVSSWFDGSNAFCAQQCIVIRRPNVPD